MCFVATQRRGDSGWLTAEFLQAHLPPPNSTRFSPRMAPPYLPEDVLFHVVEELDVDSLAKCCLVSRALKDVARRRLYQHLQILDPRSTYARLALNPPLEFHLTSTENACLLRRIFLSGTSPRELATQLGLILSVCPNERPGADVASNPSPSSSTRRRPRLTQGLPTSSTISPCCTLFTFVNFDYISHHLLAQPFNSRNPSSPSHRAQPPSPTSSLPRQPVSDISSLRSPEGITAPFPFPVLRLSFAFDAPSTRTPLARISFRPSLSSRSLSYAAAHLFATSPSSHSHSLILSFPITPKASAPPAFFHHLPSSLITIDARTLEIGFDYLLNYLSTMEDTHPHLRQLELQNIVVDCETRSWGWRTE